MPVVTMRQLLEAGVHFGHQTRRWNPKMKRYIFAERNGIYILDLQQTMTGIEKAYAALENRLKRPPSDAEIAEEMGISTDDLTHIYSQLSNVSLIALDEITTGDGEKGDKLSLLDTLEDTKTANPIEAFENEEMREILVEAVNRLSEREKKVVTFYYFAGLTLAEIGTVLGVTESRVCQIHTKAVLALKSKIAEAIGTD